MKRNLRLTFELEATNSTAFHYLFFASNSFFLVFALKTFKKLAYIFPYVLMLNEAIKFIIYNKNIKDVDFIFRIYSDFTSEVFKNLFILTKLREEFNKILDVKFVIKIFNLKFLPRTFTTFLILVFSLTYPSLKRSSKILKNKDFSLFHSLLIP